MVLFPLFLCKFFALFSDFEKRIRADCFGGAPPAPLQAASISLLVSAGGFEPPTDSLRGSCSTVELCALSRETPAFSL